MWQLTSIPRYSKASLFGLAINGVKCSGTQTESLHWLAIKGVKNKATRKEYHQRLENKKVKRNRP
ncbi:hypothetical protein EOK94_29520, partial [Klebsiella pneumoniae]